MAKKVHSSHPVLADDRSEYEAKREELKKAGVRYCLAAYTDVHGVGKAKCVPIDHFSGMALARSRTTTSSRCGRI